MILLCYDGSADAQSAIDRAGELFSGEPATVLTVWEQFIDLMALSGAGLGLGVGTVNVEGIDAASEQAARERADEGAERARRAGLKPAAPRPGPWRDDRRDDPVGGRRGGRQRRRARHAWTERPEEFAARKRFARCAPARRSTGDRCSLARGRGRASNPPALRSPLIDRLAVLPTEVVNAADGWPVADPAVGSARVVVRRASVAGLFAVAL